MFLVEEGLEPKFEYRRTSKKKLEDLILQSKQSHLDHIM